MTVHRLSGLTCESSSTCTPVLPPSSGCPIGNGAAAKSFCARIEALPHDIMEADENHPLAAFAGDPVGCNWRENEDAWEKI